MRTTVLLTGCVLTLALASPASFAAGITKTLEDFEGALIGWPDNAALSADASEGAKALRWELAGKSDPQFFYFNFGDRGVELSEWDRLVFDYKFEGAGSTWWGVKITDHPLGDGMQATWLVADAGGIRPGEWQTAAIDLQHPQWLWGDEPNKTLQQIVFRCQVQTGTSTGVLVDNVRLERDPVRIETVEPGESVREAGRFAVAYTVRLANTTEEPVRVQVGVRDTAPELAVDLSAAEIAVPAGSSRAVSVALAATVAGAEAVPALSRLSTEFFAKVRDMDDTEKTRTLTLAVPLGDIEHPCLLITRAQVPGIMAKIERSDEAMAIYDGLQQSADAWLARTPHFPDRGGQWWHWYTCKKCGARLQTESATKHVCPDCGEVYSGWPYDDVLLNQPHSELSRAIRDLGVMYVLTDEASYAGKARQILLGYAERYLKYPLHNTQGKPSKGGGHVGPQTLDESTWLIPVVQGFDCIRDTLSDEDVELIAEQMLLPAAWLIHDHQWGIHNICCWHDSAYGLVGLALENEQLAADAINGPKGFRAQIEQGVTEDGFWYESAWGYHFYTMSALHPLAIAARNVGIDLYTERYKAMYDAPLAFMAPGAALPAFNDSGTSNALGGGSRYEIAYARWQDKRHLLPVMQSGRKSLETLLFGVELEEQEEFKLDSTVFPAAGYVILRSGATGDEGVDRHVPGNYLALDYGPHGGGHGHPDKLGFVLYGKRALQAEDPGSIAYGNPAHRGWFKQTISHNTIVVNGKSQAACTGTLQFAAFSDDAGLCSARADEAYPDVRIRRSLALIGDRVIDVVLCEAAREVTFDWVYHNRGTFDASLNFADMQDPPAGDGYEWAKQWRSAQSGDDWQATWRQQDGPGIILAQAATDGERRVLTAIGMGNPTRIKVPFVVSRQTGRTALYCTALEIWEGNPPRELAVRVLPVEGGATDEKPVAIEVTGEGLRDVLLVNPDGGTIRAAQFELRGKGALLRYDRDVLRNLVLVDHSEVRVDGRAISPAD